MSRGGIAAEEVHCIPHTKKLAKNLRISRALATFLTWQEVSCPKMCLWATAFATTQVSCQQVTRVQEMETHLREEALATKLESCSLVTSLPCLSPAIEKPSVSLQDLEGSAAQQIPVRTPPESCSHVTGSCSLATSLPVVAPIVEDPWECLQEAASRPAQEVRGRKPCCNVLGMWSAPAPSGENHRMSWSQVNPLLLGTIDRRMRYPTNKALA